MEQKAVDMIFLCGADGSVRPLRFRIEDECGARTFVEVEKILKIKEITYVGMEAYIYICRTRVKERQQLAELKYDIRRHIWRLLK